MTLPLDPALLDRLPPEVRAALEAQAFALEAQAFAPTAERAHRLHLESEHAALQAHAARTAAEKVVIAAENARMAELLEELAPLIEQMRRARFAPSSEKLDPDQLQMCFEERAIVAPSVRARWRVNRPSPRRRRSTAKRARPRRRPKRPLR